MANRRLSLKDNDDGSSSDAASLYSEASHAFLLKDWNRSGSIVNGLLTELEESGREGRVDSDLARKMWILKITLLASTVSLADGGRQIDDERQSHAERERLLSQLYTRIQRHYLSGELASDSILHPSLLVATSLAGLKLRLPLFVRRTLEDYFDALLYEPAGPDESGTNMHGTNGDSSLLDDSHADLSLSGIVASGPSITPASSAERKEGWSKSLLRLSRIYAVHLLGKTLGEWDEARIWINTQRLEDEQGVHADATHLVAAGDAQVLMNELENARLSVERIEQEKRQQAEARTLSRPRQSEQERMRKETDAADRQAKRNTKGKGRETSPVSGSSQSSARTALNGQNGHSTQQAETASSHHTTSSRRRQDLSVSTPSKPGAKRETGFAAFRSSLSSLLPSTSSSAPTRRPETALDFLKAYLKQLASSRVLNALILLFLLFGAWRRRLSRSGRGESRIGREARKYWERARDKVLQTVKMGGSLGYL